MPRRFIGSRPNGYQAEKIPHSAPARRAEDKTTRRSAAPNRHPQTKRRNRPRSCIHCCSRSQRIGGRAPHGRARQRGRADGGATESGETAGPDPDAGPVHALPVAGRDFAWVSNERARPVFDAFRLEITCDKPTHRPVPNNPHRRHNAEGGCGGRW
jgi:hypothetical protein